jgi:hypothetical protein
MLTLYSAQRGVDCTVSMLGTFLQNHFPIVLPVVLYGCENWSMTLREEHRLRVFENRMWRRI